MPFMDPLRLIRIPIALVWTYQGLWCKVLGLGPHQEAIVQSVPFWDAATAHGLLVVLGMAECGLALWVLSGWQARWAAVAQILLLVSMNGGGLIWGRNFIPDPAGMVIQNLAFITLIVIATGEVRIGSDAGQG
jgi:DoxX-like family